MIDAENIFLYRKRDGVAGLEQNQPDRDSAYLNSDVGSSCIPLDISYINAVSAFPPGGCFVYYNSDVDSSCVSQKQLDMPLIAIARSYKRGVDIYAGFDKTGRHWLRCLYDEQGQPYHYGCVVGKYDKETLLCVECVAYDERFDFFCHGLGLELTEELADSLICMKIDSDEATVDTIEKQTRNFTARYTYIWWDSDLKQVLSPESHLQAAENYKISIEQERNNLMKEMEQRYQETDERISVKEIMAAIVKIINKKQGIDGGDSDGC